MNSLIILLQADNEIKLEMFLTGGDANCHMLDILRSLTTEQLEQLKPTAVMHENYTGDECQGGENLDPLGTELDIDECYLFSKPDSAKMDMDDNLCI